MADYVAPFAAGKDVTLTVGATAVVGGNLLKVSAAKTVIPTTAAGKDWIGVATTDGAIGAKVGVTSGGVQELVASAAIAAGALVTPAAAGKVATIGAGVFGEDVGLALTAAAADGDKIWVKMNR